MCRDVLLHVVEVIMLYYNNAGEFFDSSMFGQGAGPILDGYLNCNGSEGNILNCRHFSHDYSGCTHTNDVSIRCEPGTYCPLFRD